MIAINAGAAIYVAGLANSHQDGVQLALQTLDSGKAWQKLSEFATFTQS